MATLAPEAPVATMAPLAPAFPVDHVAATFDVVPSGPTQTATAEAPAAPGTVRRGLGAIRAFVLSGLLGAVVAVVAMFLLSIPLGFRSLTVMSGSMDPNLGVGDVVIERQISPTDVRVGDIVTFRDPTDQQTLITHRVRSFKVHDGTVDFVTKGDANNTVERWSIQVNGRLAGSSSCTSRRSATPWSGRPAGPDASR